MNSKIVFGQYYNSGSWIHRLDPRTKIISALLLIVALFLMSEAIALGISLALTLLLIVTTKIPFSKFLASLRAMSMLLFITVLLQVLFNRGGEYQEIQFHFNFLNSLAGIGILILYFLSKRWIKKGRFFLFLVLFIVIFYLQTVLINDFLFQFDYPVKFYMGGLLTSLIIVMRIISLLFISSLLTLTTTPTDMNVGLESLAKPLKLIGIKVSILSMMISIALRFIPTLINEANKILKAQASRGVDFREGKFKDKITQIISLLVPMFIISYRRATDLADAMEARGYIPEGKRTSINKLRFRAIDIISLFLQISLLGALIYFKVTDNVQI